MKIIRHENILSELTISDPFARVAFVNQSAVTEKVEKTLCPTWDQTLIFEQVEIHGDPALIVEKPPEVIIEVFDHDTFVSTAALCHLCHDHIRSLVTLAAQLYDNPPMWFY